MESAALDDGWARLNAQVIRAIASVLKRTKRWRRDGPALRSLNKHWCHQLNQNVTSIRFARNFAIDKEDITSLKKFPNVEVFDATRFYYVPSEEEQDSLFLELVKIMVNFPNLRSLETNADMLEMLTEREVSQWSQLSCLNLCMLDNPSTTGVMPKLMQLKLSAISIASDLSTANEVVAALPSLEELDLELRTYGDTDHGVRHMSHLTILTALAFSSFHAVDDVSVLSNLPKLKRVSFRMDSTEIMDSASFAQLLMRLTELDITAQLRGRDFLPFDLGIVAPNLTVLHLNGFRLEANVVLANLRSLKSVTFDYCQYGDGYTSLTTLSGLTKLRLSTSGRGTVQLIPLPLTHDVFPDLADLRATLVRSQRHALKDIVSLSKLEALELDLRLPLSKSNLRSFGRLSNLRSLTLTGKHIRFGSHPKFYEMHFLTNLEHLELCISVKEMMFLAGVYRRRHHIHFESKAAQGGSRPRNCHTLFFTFLSIIQGKTEPQPHVTSHWDTEAARGYVFKKPPTHSLRFSSSMLRDVFNWFCLKQGVVNVDLYPTEPICSLASLPEELYCHVLLRIFVHASPSDHLSLLLVSKTWNAAGHMAPFVLCPNNFLPLALRRGFPKVGSLDLSAACEVRDERLPCLVGLENLVALRLERCREITDAGLVHLHPLTQLQSLNLGRCIRITDDGLSLLCKHLTCLRHLNVKYCYGLTSEGLAELKCLSLLTSFNASGCQGLRFEALSMIGMVSCLKVLKLNYCSAAISQGIDPLFKLTSLHALQLKADDAQLPDTNALLQGLACYMTQLQRLELAMDSAVNIAGFEALMSLSRLEFLHLMGHGLMEKHICDIVSRLPALRTFQLSNDGPADAALVALPSLRHLSSLTIKQSPGSCDLSDAGPYLDGLSDLTGLTELVLWNTVSLAGTDVTNLTSLRELYLKGCPLLCSQNMRGFSQLRQLRVLKFENCDQLDDEIVHVLQWLLHLEQLYFSSCPSIRGHHFAKLSQLTELSTIVFQFSSGINDSILKHLSLIASLRRLELVMCPHITEDGVRVLMNGEMKNLEYLTIAGGQSPKLETEDFQSKLPKFKKLLRNSLNLSML